jgi:hypothetical protein
MTINQTNQGCPSRPCPFYEQAVDEVAAVFDQIPDSVMVALSASMGSGWYAKAQDTWCDQRAARLRIEDDQHRMDSQEP